MRLMMVRGAAVLVMLCLSSCADLLSPDGGCRDCPGGAHWEYTCVGWIAPVCDTYCVSNSGGGVRVLDGCCCSGKALPAAAPATSAPGGGDIGPPRASGGETPVAWPEITARYE